MTTELHQKLAQRIAADGPMPISDFMAEAVATYYRRPQVFGRHGDFVTAPEISQIFGELVGVWIAVNWMAAGSPCPFALVECGPGRGTLMQDALRATAKIPGFHDALQLHLIETSPRLRQTQAETLHRYAPVWHTDLSTLPELPLYVIANEFLDALPIQQYQFVGDAWRERCVGLTDGKLEFQSGVVTSPPRDLLHSLAPPSDGDFLEHSPAVDRFITDLSVRLVRQGGTALFFDYGYTEPAYGDTLQAMSQHAYADVLSSAGNADLTAHVNFHRIKQVAQAVNATVHGPATQGDWLASMGLEARLSSLYRTASAEQQTSLVSGARRLVDPQAMGRLFKTIAISTNATYQPEGFCK
jgi:NADH dehydrogenase [ubiquinone] 1 alpha subcomplex assembly factor 7